jgi:hypothetical protein
MGNWLKANGGPVALVVVGLGLVGYTTRYGWFVVVAGGTWLVYERLPWRIAIFRRGQVAAVEDLPDDQREERVFRQRLKRHVVLGRERVAGMRGDLPAQEDDPGLEKQIRETAEWEARQWKEEARSLLSRSPQMLAHFDEPSRLADGPRIALADADPRAQARLDLEWGVGRLEQLADWLDER